MACTLGGEARLSSFHPLVALAARFSAFFFFLTSCLFSVLVLLSLSLSCFILFLNFFSTSRTRGKKGGRPREITRPPWAPARPSCAQRSLLSQFANWGPGPNGSFICILRFFEVKLTRRLPLPTTTFLIIVAHRSFSLLRGRSGTRIFSRRAGRLLARSRRHGPPTQKTTYSSSLRGIEGERGN